MSTLTNAAIAAYIGRLSHLPHEELNRVEDEGLSGHVPIVDAQTGSLLHTLVRVSGAERILEIGTAIGYSTIWMASAMPPGGMLITLERDQARAAIARAHIDAAGLADRVNVMIGDAERYLHKLAGPFDLVFQDGDKRLYEPLLDRLVDLLRPGGMLVTDNVLWDGEVVPGYTDTPHRSPEDTAAIARYNERLAADSRLATSWLPVGDGVAIAVKKR